MVRAESHDADRQSQAATFACPGASSNDREAMRVFVLVRPAVEDVTALVGLDQAGLEVQRIPFTGPNWS